MKRYEPCDCCADEAQANWFHAGIGDAPSDEVTANWFAATSWNPPDLDEDGEELDPTGKSESSRVNPSAPLTPEEHVERAEALLDSCRLPGDDDTDERGRALEYYPFSPDDEAAEVATDRALQAALIHATLAVAGFQHRSNDMAVCPHGRSAPCSSCGLAVQEGRLP